MKALCQILIALLAATAGLARAADLRIEDACQHGEEWSVGKGDPNPALAAVVKQFHQGPPAGEFALAAKLRQDSKLAPLAEYWIARLYFDAGLTGLAAERFNRLLSNETVDGLAAIRGSALACLGAVHLLSPTLTLSDEAKQRLTKMLAEDGKHDEITDNAAVLALVPSLVYAKSATDRALAEALAKTDGLAGQYLQALRTVKSGGDALDSLKALRKGHARKLLAGQETDLRLLFGRALYQAGRFDDALDELGEIEASAPGYAAAQSDRAWALLKKNDPARALKGLHDQAATLPKDVFLPETAMVTAIAYQGLCLYPEALEAVKVFRRDAAPILQWLATYHAKPAGERMELYPQATAYRDGKSTSAPKALAAYWTRSSLFQAETQRLEQIPQEEAALTRGLGETLPEGKPVDTALVAEGKRAFASDTAKYRDSLGARRAELHAWIEGALARQTAHLAHQLKEVEENLQLLEVEVLNGATKDLVARTERPPERLLALTALGAPQGIATAEPINQCKEGAKP